MNTKSSLLNWNHIAVSLSLANLCFLRRWKELLTYTGADRYLMKLPPAPGQYWAAIVNVLLLGVVTFLLIQIITRAHGRLGRVARGCFLVLLLIPLNAFREVISQYVPFLRGPLIRVLGESGTGLVVGLVMLSAVAAVLVWPSRINRAAMAVLLMLAFFVPVTILHAAWSAWTYDDRPFLDQPLAARVKNDNVADPRVVWIIFDELDQRIAFDGHYPGVELPELNRFRSAAFYATRAYPPAGATLISLPSLISGRLVRQAKVVSARELDIQYAGSNTPVRWGTEPNVFSRARALGFNTALVGWYHPYCRILNRDLSSCYWSDMEQMANSTGRQFGQALPYQLRSLLESSIYSPFGQSLPTLKRTRNYAHTLEAGRQAVTDNTISLCMLHLQPPHTPQAFNRRTGKFDLRNSSVSGYLDGLVLADHTLGALRRSMEEAGTWTNTSVVISSDHWFRDARVFDGKLDRRVPFLVKMAGQTSALSYDQPFNTTLTQGLLLAILRGEVRAAADVAHWLRRHGSEMPAEPVS